jgi:hypothetical protein
MAYSGVACPTSKACVTVGSDDLLNGKSAVIDTATGAVRAWSGSLTSGAMNKVACPGKSTCLAVADDAVATVKASNGAMKVTDKLKPPANGIVALDAIACASARSCYAVGFEGSRLSSEAIVVRLSGAGKQLGLTKDTGTGFCVIACPSSTLCLISAASHAGVAIQLLKGSRLGTSHQLPAKTFIQRITCYQAKVCYALGGEITLGFSPADELFPVNPRTGAIGKVIKISGLSGTGMTCMSAAKCLIVGFSGVGASSLPAVLTVSHGKPGKPTRLGPAKASFADVACASATVCYAVGNITGKGLVIKAAG